MGSTRWDTSDWTTYSRATVGKSRTEIFRARSMDPSLDPSKFKVRESRDSDANPSSTPIVLAVDVTGSMGVLAELIVKKDLGVIMKEIYERLPVPDPHVACAAIGDTYVDSAPFQVTQFEAGVAPLTDQVEKIYLEGGGGGNRGESYLATWFFAAYKTACDSQIKRGRKGYIFTIGDEPPLSDLPSDHVREHLDPEWSGGDLTAGGLLETLAPNWEVFHLRVNDYPGAEAAWKKLLGERAITVTDHQKLAEIIVSTIQIVEGADRDEVVDSWSGDTSLVVATATKAVRPANGTRGVVTL